MGTSIHAGKNFKTAWKKLPFARVKISAVVVIYTNDDDIFTDDDDGCTGSDGSRKRYTAGRKFPCGQTGVPARPNTI